MASPLKFEKEREMISRPMRGLAFVLYALCAGCQTRDHAAEHRSEWSPQVLGGVRFESGLHVTAPSARASVYSEDPARNIWPRLGKGFTLLDNNGSNSRIEQQRDWFIKHPSYLDAASSRASRYLHFIAQRLNERKMPAELALLPIIESAYNPLANSNREAVGLWQFIPSTGRDFNLRQTRWYDGRRDILASSKAAMDYLTRLHNLFNDDWLLALAAYNAGEGTVSRAIKSNQNRGLPIDYWHLSLPQETKDYVPRLLALSILVRDPQMYGIKLNPIPDVPYFEVVKLNHTVSLVKVAADAGIDEAELLVLNPAFLKRVTLDGPAHLLVPRAKAHLLSVSLSRTNDESLGLLPVPQEQKDNPETMIAPTMVSDPTEKLHSATVKTITPDKIYSPNVRVVLVVAYPARHAH